MSPSSVHEAEAALKLGQYCTTFTFLSRDSVTLSGTSAPCRSSEVPTCFYMVALQITHDLFCFSSTAISI